MCINCTKTTRKNQSTGTCSNCNTQVHTKCLIDRFDNGTEKLYCSMCYVNNDQSTTSSDESGYEDLNKFMKAKGLNIFHQNVNDLTNKIIIFTFYFMKHIKIYIS